MPNELQELIDEHLDPEDYLPAELLLNDDHPDADKYSEARRDIDRKLTAFGRLLKPEKRELARLSRTDMTPKQIAKRLNRSVNTVYKWAKQPDVLRYIALLDHYQRFVDGADTSHRKGILYRIAIANEDKRPNVSIQAIQEINKMSGTYAEHGNAASGNQINIQINGELLPRGALDQMPETFETKVIEGNFERE